MELLIKNMEDIVRHTRHLSRFYNSSAQVQNTAFINKKNHNIEFTFETYNFSFILKGRGSYLFRGKEYEVTAPCVLTQMPGEKMYYGPHDTWTELYLIYPGNIGDYLINRNFLSYTRPIWNISSISNFNKKVLQFIGLLSESEINGDLLDYAAEGLILESLLGISLPEKSFEEQQIHLIKDYISMNYKSFLNHTDIADEYGISLSTFRRRWIKYVGIPPGKYQSDLIMHEACRLLAETFDSINSIASMLNFDDPLYFTKKFKAEIGVNPSTYRKQHNTILIK